MQPEELAAEEKRIEDEAAALEKTILKMDGSVTSSSQVANALAQSLKLTPEDRAATLLSAQEKLRTSAQPLLSQIRQSLSKNPATKNKRAKVGTTPQS